MISSPPPLPDATPVGSFYHSAAAYAVWILPISIAANLALSGIARELPIPVLRVAVSLIPALLLFSAIPAGVVALCGIKKHGKKKLLWKGLTGIIIPILLTAMAIPAAIAIKKASASQTKPFQQIR